MKDNRYSESDVTTQPVKIAARNVQVYYGDSHAIRDVDIDINDKDGSINNNVSNDVDGKRQHEDCVC